MLDELGYLVDSSVDPFFNEKRKGGPSFAGAPITPYFVSRDDPRRAGESDLLEIPITSALDRKWPHWLADGLRRRDARLPVPARPAAVAPRPAHLAATVVLEDRGHDRSRPPGAPASRRPSANIIFHSSELLAGGSPYNETRSDVDRFYHELEALLAFLTEGGARGATFRSFRERLGRGARHEVCMVTPHLPPDQAANALLPQLLRDGLVERGHDVRLMAFEPRAGGERKPDVTYVRRPRNGLGAKAPALPAGDVARGVPKDRAAFRGVDVVHMHCNTFMNQVAAAIAHRRGLPFLLTHYGTEIWHYRRGRSIRSCG